MKSRFRYIFARRGLNRYNKGRVDIEIYFDRETRVYLDTGLRLLESEWNTDRAMPYVNTKAGQGYLKIIQDLQRKIEDYEFALILKEQEVKPWMVRQLIRGTLQGSSSPFAGFMEAEIKKEFKLTPQTIRTHNQTLNKIKAYDSTTPLEKINFEWIRGLDSYMVSLGLHPNTIEGHHRRVRKYLLMAVKYDLITVNPYRSFKLHKVPTNKQALTREEMDRIEAADYSGNPRLDRVRNLFLFSCWTGLRYNELKNLAASNLVITSTGYEITLHELRKYPTPVFLPLGKLFNGKPDRMIRKWIKNGELWMGIVNNVKLNVDLKQIAFDCSIQKPLSWHIARHTFATEIGARTGNVFLVKALLGHRDIKTSMVYVKMTPENVRRNLSNAQIWE